ncbi:MAG TPA: hypothetical protein DCM86_17005 [Verrucomicrobiales bacterium]|nr:hypothetical protein [Verrucomicrobiales bacterium]
MLADPRFPGFRTASPLTRREFLGTAGRVAALGGVALGGGTPALFGQPVGERPDRTGAQGVTLLNPRTRVPVGLIIDDSTCLVNLNRFSMAQFDAAFEGANPVYHRPWKEWPSEIPDAFIREFGQWAVEAGVKGKFSIVPYPACVGRLDRLLPGWSQQELRESLDLVRTLMVPNWDIHPEMITHTRVIDLRTGQPHPEVSLKFMENWDWTTGRSADEIGEYMAYALQILKNVGLPCEGVTTPGGFGGRALPQLSVAAMRAVREVHGAEIPHYFRHLFDHGEESVVPRVENVSGLAGEDPRCVVSLVACTGDWTGGWDNTEPGGVDRFISKDLKSGRMVEVIQRGEPALMLAHWTGVYWNGRRLGFAILKEVSRRLKARFENLIWMKLSEVARYWAARELTRIERTGEGVSLRAPFACPDFTFRFNTRPVAGMLLRWGDRQLPVRLVEGPLKLVPGSWCPDRGGAIVCLPLPKGASRLELAG